MSMDMTNLLRGATRGVGGGPKRTIQEMASEFGVPVQTLINLLSSRGGPKPVLRHASATKHSTWYAPKAMREWWAALPEDVRKKPRS